MARLRMSPLLVIALVSSSLVLITAPPAVATPVATSQAEYAQYGRAFPDPHGCASGPNISPWAKGNVCATQFIQWTEALGGLQFLETKFGRYMDLLNLRTDVGSPPELAGLDMRSAGLPEMTLTRDRRDLYAVKVTDTQSTIPEPDRKHFAYALSIHGIERAGVEGGIRAIEDLVTWAACEQNPQPTGVPACANAPAGEGPYPKRILEPSNSGPTAGEVLHNSVIYFFLSNPDGWQRGEFSQGGVFFQRYNGNGMDLNRDWPTKGYIQKEYTPWSEPETIGVGRYLEHIESRTTAKKFDGGIDLHGMVTAPSFSFTLLGAGQRDYRKNQRTVETAVLTFKDSEKRLIWSDMIAPSGQCPGNVQEPVFGGNVPMCSDQWGTVWDTINYQVTGSMGDWMDSDLGLNAVGINNEMALSHVAPNQTFHPEVEQLHIDGNKGLIYSQIASLLFEQPVSFVPKGKVGYIFDPVRLTNAGIPPHPASSLPPQAPITGTEPTGAAGFQFTVQGPTEGVSNGGLAVEATCGNASGIGSCSGTGAATISMILDYCGPGPAAGTCSEVASYFNQSPFYSQAGTRIDLNDPQPGIYRIRANPSRVGPTRYEVKFTRGHSYPEPHQAPYDVSRMDFFTDLNKYVPDAQDLTPIDVPTVLQSPGILGNFDSVVVADEFMPGAAGFSETDRANYASALEAFARNGGNLVLTDEALQGLSRLGLGIGGDKVSGGFFYAGWMNFNDGKGSTYKTHHLAREVNKEGTAEGRATIGSETFTNRHQTYEPVPLGYFVGPSGSANASCNTDKCDSPNWIVNEDAWKKAGGSVAARTLVRVNPVRPPSGQPDPTVTGVSLGEIRLGQGVVRIAGALLPTPTEQNHHPFGLSSYAPTYTGYQLFENLIDYSKSCKGVLGPGGLRVIGTEAGELLLGTPGSDLICGFGGNDTIRSGKGNDIVIVNRGRDRIFGQKGRDRLLGDEGKDRLRGQRGRDVLRGAKGGDRIAGGIGNDRLAGGRGRDLCSGGRGKDRRARCERGRS